MKVLKLMVISGLVAIFGSNLFADTNVSGNKWGVWSLAGSPYIVTGNVSVPAGSTLTIEYGVRVKFNNGTLLGVNGTLIADGTPTDTIVFTANQVSPSPGDWYGIKLYDGSTNSVLDYCVVEYAGSGSSELIYVGLHGTASASITNSVMRNSAYYGIRVGNSSSPTITGNTITGNTNHAIYMNANCFPSFSNNTASGNGTDGIAVYGTVTHTGVWNADLPFVVTGSINVPDTVTLTINPEVVVKFNSGTLLGVDGTLIADGTPTDTIVFTANQASPSPGDWYGIKLYDGSTNSVLDYCVVEYAGSGSSELIYVGLYGTASASITNSVIRNSAYYGIRVSNSSSPTITGNTITDNGNYGIRLLQSSNPIIRNNTFTNNTYGVYCSDSSDPTINYNNIVGNSDYGVYNSDSRLIVDATNNWWGDSTGPAGVGPGIGDSVSNYVDYAPWLGYQFDTPDIYVSPDTLAFTCGSSKTADTLKTMTVFNNGGDTLFVSNIVGTETWIVDISDTSFSVAPGDSQNVTVTVTLNGLGDSTYYANLEISSNDPDEATYSEPVKLIVKLFGTEESLVHYPYGLTLAPNPVGQNTAVVRYALSEKSRVTISIYDLSGRLIENLVDANKKAGQYKIDWNTKQYPTGIYFVRLTAGNYVATKKLTLTQ